MFAVLPLTLVYTTFGFSPPCPVRSKWHRPTHFLSPHVVQVILPFLLLWAGTRFVII
jgi:hypothetical protein